MLLLGTFLSTNTPFHEGSEIKFLPFFTLSARKKSTKQASSSYFHTIQSKVEYVFLILLLTAGSILSSPSGIHSTGSSTFNVAFEQR